jgi:hypothetical protein
MRPGGSQARLADRELRWLRAIVGAHCDPGAGVDGTDSTSTEVFMFTMVAL